MAASFWYNFRNNFWQHDFDGDYESNLGLVRVDFSWKPAYDAMRSWTGGATTTTAVPTTTTAVAPTTTVPLPAIDIQASVISNVAIQRVTRTSAIITWTTNESSTSQVELGTTSLTKSVTGVGGTGSHTVELSGLTRGTTYQFRARSVDTAGNATTSAISSFTTPKK